MQIDILPSNDKMAQRQVASLPAPWSIQHNYFALGPDEAGAPFGHLLLSLLAIKQGNGVTTAGSRPGAKKTRRKRRGRRWILIPIQGQRGQHKYNTDTLGNTKEWHNTNTGSDGSIPRQRQKTCRPSFFPSHIRQQPVSLHCNDEVTGRDLLTDRHTAIYI